MVVADIAPFGVDVFTDVDFEGATCAEMATARRIGRAGNVAFQDDTMPLVLDGRIDHIGLKG